MMFLVDECCDFALVEALRSDGHDVLYAAENLRGHSDDEILQHAFRENRVLISEDKDFGELVYRLSMPTRGIILLRFDISERESKLPRLRSLLQNDPDRVPGAFIVLELDKYRIRPLTNS